MHASTIFRTEIIPNPAWQHKGNWQPAGSMLSKTSQNTVRPHAPACRSPRCPAEGFQAWGLCRRYSACEGTPVPQPHTPCRTCRRRSEKNSNLANLPTRMTKYLKVKIMFVFHWGTSFLQNWAWYALRCKKHGNIDPSDGNIIYSYKFSFEHITVFYSRLNSSLRCKYDATTPVINQTSVRQTVTAATRTARRVLSRNWLTQIIRVRSLICKRIYHTVLCSAEFSKRLHQGTYALNPCKNLICKCMRVKPSSVP